MADTSKIARKTSLAALGLFAAALLLPGLGNIDLWAPDEPRYAQVAEEVRSLENGPSDLVLLRLAGKPYTQKPPLYYWLAALAGSVEGRVSERAARLPSALAGIACVLLTAGFGFRLFARGAPGLWAGFLLLTSWRFAYSARRAQLDILLSFFELVAFFALWQNERGRSSHGTIALLHAALGLALLTKGPVAFLPLAAYALFLVWERRLPEIRPLLAPWGFAISLGPVAIWLGGAVLLAPSGFFDAAFTENVLGRFFSGTAHVRPFYYYLYQLPLDALPWVLLAPLVFFAGRNLAEDERSAWRFLAVGAATSLIFFSLSAGKRGVYLLPIFPLLALLLGDSIDRMLRQALTLPERLVFLARATPLFLGLGIGIVGLGLAFGSLLGFEVASVMMPPTFGVILASCGALLAIAGRSPEPRRALTWTLASAMGVLAAIFQLGLPALDATKSPRPIAERAARLAAPGSPIGALHHEALIGGLAYYSDGHPIRFLPTVADVPRFLRDAGGTIVVGRQHFASALAERAGMVAKERWRSGGRQIAVFVPAGESPGDPDP